MGRGAGPDVLEAGWDAEDAGGKLQILLFDVCARRGRFVRSKVSFQCQHPICRHGGWSAATPLASEQFSVPNSMLLHGLPPPWRDVLICTVLACLHCWLACCWCRVIAELRHSHQELRRPLGSCATG